MASSASAQLAASLGTVFESLAQARRAALALLVVVLVGSVLSAVSAVPAMLFPRSRLLIYFNMLWPCLASACSFLAAVILSVLVAGVSSLGNAFGKPIGMEFVRGGTVLLFVWLAWLLAVVPSVYWVAVWFFETRRVRFVRRRRVRARDEMGSWHGAGREMWRGLVGRRID